MPVAVEDIEMSSVQGPSTSAAETSPHLQQSKPGPFVQVDERAGTNAAANNFGTNEKVGNRKNASASTFSNQSQASIPNNAELNGQAAQFDHPELLPKILEHETYTQAEVVDVDHKSNKSSNHSFAELENSLLSPSTTASQTSLGLQPIRNESVNEQVVERSNSTTTSGIDEETLKTFHDAVDREDISCLEKTLKSMPSRRSRVKLLNSHRPGDEHGEAALHRVVKNNNLFLARFFIKHGAIVASRDTKGRTPLHYAAMDYKNESESQLPHSSKEHTMFDVLFEAGADVNAQDNDGRTCLHHAARNNNPCSAELLIKLGANVRVRSKRGTTALHNFAQYFKSQESAVESLETGMGRTIFDVLVQAGADVNAQDNQRYTPLHIAAGCNNILSTKILIKHRASVTDRDHDGGTALHHAAIGFKSELQSPDSSKKPTIFDVLIDAGADVNAQDNDGRTPLHGAAATNSSFSVKLLVVNHGANVHVRDKDGCMFLHHAARLFKSGSALDLSLSSEQARTMFDVVMRAGAEVNAQDNDGWTPLHHAVTKNKICFAKLLIEYGANVNISDIRKSTPLHCFVGYLKNQSQDESSESVILNLLIAAGADVNARNSKGDTPLHVAVKWENESVAERLLALPVINPSLADHEGCLPLHLAIKLNRKSNTFRMLLDAVLQRRELAWNLTMPNRETPLHVALQHVHPKLVTQILDKLCIRTNLVCVNDADEDGQTALHYACQSGLFEICVQLLENGAVKDLDVRSKDEGWRPLDLAIVGGFDDICELISEYEANLLIDAKVLRFACIRGHVETVRWCINNCTIDLSVKDGNSFFREAVESKQEQVAKYIIQETPLWRDVLCERNITNDGILNTPMRDLVRTMPDVARQALDRCTLITSSGSYFIYELIDDAYLKWQREVHVWDGKNPEGSRNYRNRQRLNYSPYTSDPRVLQDNHVVSLMLKYDRDDLIVHPVVSTLIEQKWRKFGYKVILASFICYSLFLATLTIYSTAAAPVNSLYYLNKTLFAPFWKADKCNNFTTNVPFKANISNETDVCRVFENRSSTFNCNIVETGGAGSINHFIMHDIRFVLLFCSIALLAAKLSYLYAKHKFEDLLACCVYSMTIAVTLPWRGFDCMYRTGLLESWAWQVPSINILLAYILLALKLEFAPGLAIYVHLLKNVSATMLRVLAGPFGIMLIASSSCFHMIFKASVRHEQFVKLLVNGPNDYSAGWDLNPFYSFPKAVLKTLVMLIGEYDLETHFMANDVTVAPIMLMFLVLFGTIALMNLLIGLATSDVGARAQEQAELQQLKMQITCSLEVERLIRSSFIGKYSYFKKLLRSDVDSVHTFENFHLEQNWPSNKLRLVHEPLKILWKLLVLCYHTIFLDPRYAKKLSERLKVVQMEQSKSAEHARTRKSAKDVRWKSKAAEEANKAKILTEEVSRIKVLVEEISRVKVEHGKALTDLAKWGETHHREMGALIVAKFDEISRRLPTTAPNA